jgi:hypothetical protein
MFVRASYRKRVIAACGFAFIGQGTAILVINNYGPTVYKALGYGTVDQLILQCGWISMAIPLNLLGVSTASTSKSGQLKFPAPILILGSRRASWTVLAANPL